MVNKFNADKRKKNKVQIRIVKWFEYMILDKRKMSLTELSILKKGKASNSVLYNECNMCGTGLSAW